jgi:transposase
MEDAPHGYRTRMVQWILRFNPQWSDAELPGRRWNVRPGTDALTQTNRPSNVYHGA